MAYLDYDVNNQPSKQHVIDHFSKYYHPGAIPLLHNVSSANHDALQQIIQDLKKEGYAFGSLYDLQKWEKYKKVRWKHMCHVQIWQNLNDKIKKKS